MAFVKKRMSIEEARELLVEHIKDLDYNSICDILGAFFDVKCSVNECVEEIEIEPTDTYEEGIFGTFDSVAEIKKESCECGKIFDPTIDVFAEYDCGCGNENEHFHCSSCGGVKTDSF